MNQTRLIAAVTTIVLVIAAIAFVAWWRWPTEAPAERGTLWITLSQELPDQGDVHEGGPCRFTVEPGATLTIADGDGAVLDTFVPEDGRTEHHADEDRWTCDIQVAATMASRDRYHVSVPNGDSIDLKHRDDRLYFAHLDWPGVAEITGPAPLASPDASPIP